MPYKFRVSKKKEAVIPVQAIKGRFDLLKEWFIARPLWMAVAGAILVVILIMLPAYKMFARQSEDRAWALEIEASRLFHEKPAISEADQKDVTKRESSVERLTKASILYDDILRRYPETMAAVIAKFEGGNVYFDLEKYDLAEKLYLAFIKEEADRTDLLPLVHIRLAYLYQKQKKDALSLDHFRIVYELEGGLNKDQAGFERGSLLEKIGKKAEAIEIYKKVSDTFKDSPWGTEAKTRLTMLDPSTATSTLTNVMPPTMPPMAATQPASVVAKQPVPVPAQFSPKPKIIPAVISAKPVVGIPVTPKVAPKVIDAVAPKLVETSPLIVPAVGVPAHVPTLVPAPAPSPSNVVPLQITPEQLRLLREKGSLTVPLPPQPEAPVVPAPPVPQPSSEPKQEGGTPSAP